MTIAWALNAFGHYVTTVGVLLIFLYLWATPRFAEDFKTPDIKLAYIKHQRSLLIAVGLLAAWLVVQYLAIIVL